MDVTHDFVHTLQRVSEGKRKWTHTLDIGPELNLSKAIDGNRQYVNKQTKIVGKKVIKKVKTVLDVFCGRLLPTAPDWTLDCRGPKFQSLSLKFLTL